MNDLQEAERIIKQFLEALSHRDLEAASSYLAPAAKIVFPGGRLYNNLDEHVKTASGRYLWVRKTLDQVDSAKLADGFIVVYFSGRLHGVNLHDIPFSDVRFIDRFVLKEGLIFSQEVWNDLAESGVLHRKQAPDEA